MTTRATVHREGDLYVIDVEDLGTTQAEAPDKVAEMIKDYCDSAGVQPGQLHIDWTALYPDECCLIMASQVYQHCHDHGNPFDCPDQLIVKSYPGPYGLVIHDGGQSILMIDFCPWCGSRLPQP